MMKFRLAVPDDATPATEMQCRSWQATFTGLVADEVITEMAAARRANAQERFANSQGTLHVGERAGEIVCLGAFVASDQADLPDYLNIKVFYVDPEHFRRGIGRQFMNYALDLARMGGYPGVLLDVLEKNHRARAFYESCGFAQDIICGEWQGLALVRYVLKF